MKAACPDDRRSTTAYSVFLSTNLLSWGTKKKAAVSRSSAEAEYKALAVTASELDSYYFPTCFAIWVFVSLSLHFCDNLSVTLYSIGLFTRSSMPERKMPNLDYHFVREKVARGDLKVLYVRTDNQTADVFTKGLSSSRFFQLRDNWLLHHGDEQRGVAL